jgi:hypothetical protein
MRVVVLASLAVAALSALLVAPAPGYDPWMWLVWGREIASGTLSTTDGPAFKPLPVAVCAVLSVVGDDAAPVVWVVLARAAAATAVALAFVVGRRLGGTVGGVLAAAGVFLCGAYPTYAAYGDVTGLFLALVLAGVLAWWDGAPRLALACAIGCALLRVEAWPFVLVLGVLLWRREAELRRWLLAAAVLVPAAWFVPEWLGSGDLLRSGDRARIPNPGQPAEAGIPFVASLGDAVALPLLPLLVAAFLTRKSRPLALAGGAWVLLVALMAQAGFSGEARYALPGAALLAIAGAVAIVTARVELAVIVGLFAIPAIVDLPDVRAYQDHKWTQARDLDDAIAVAGGRGAVLSCGTPYVGPYRGPLLAHRLDVAKEDVEPDALPRPPGTVFRSRLNEGSPVAPPARGFGPARRAGVWEVTTRCR